MHGRLNAQPPPTILDSVQSSLDSHSEEDLVFNPAV